MSILGLFNHWAFVIIMMLGLYAIIARNNMIKKILGLALFQTGIFLMYILENIFPSIKSLLKRKCR